MPTHPEPAHRSSTTTGTSSNTQLHLFSAAFGERELPPPPTADAWVSDLEWISASNGWGPVERDTSNAENAAGDGGPITLDGVVHEKGLGVHAESVVSFHLGGNCSRFTADVGVDDEVPDYGSIDFAVVADGVERYRSPAMAGTSATEQADVDLTGVGIVNLVVGSTDASLSGDHGDWASARFTCG